MKFNFFKSKKQSKAKPKKRVAKSSRVALHLDVINKESIRLLLKSIVMSQATNIITPTGFVFDMDSIVISSGQLVGAQATMLQIKGATAVFYIESLLAQFEIDQNNDLKPTEANLRKLREFLTKIVADQIFAIESRPNDKSN